MTCIMHDHLESMVLYAWGYIPDCIIYLSSHLDGMLYMHMVIDSTFPSHAHVSKSVQSGAHPAHMQRQTYTYTYRLVVHI